MNERELPSFPRLGTTNDFDPEYMAISGGRYDQESEAAMTAKIWLDMDGVFADFDGHYEKHFGYRPVRWPLPDTTDYKLVNALEGGFYRTIPVMDGIRELLDLVKVSGHPHSFLTGLPVSAPLTANEKVEWRDKHFPEAPIICCPAKDKFMHGRPGDILIDDYLRYRVAWETMGGIFIHHTDVPSSIAQLRELGICARSSEGS